MRRMNVIMRNKDNNSDNDEHHSYPAPPEISRKHECINCRAEFPNKTTAERHMLFCKTLADIRRGSSGGTTSSVLTAASDDPLLPTQREMFILIQELAAKYNKVKDELDVMKQWAKMVGRRIGTAGVGSCAGIDFTSVTRQKRQNMEVILNEEDAEHPELAELRPGFTEWLSSDTAIILTDADLNIVFHEDLVAGITSAILRILAEHTTESGKSHLVPFKLADIKQGAFYIYDTAFKVTAETIGNSATDPPSSTSASVKKWRAIEPCEFQLLVRTFHKWLFKEFKKWQDQNWEAQQQMMKQRQNAASSYHQVMSSLQSSPAMTSCDGMYSGATPMTSYEMISSEDIPSPVTGSDAILSEDFATLYNKYADKMMGGALTDDTILSRVRVKLWKDMKAWRL